MVPCRHCAKCCEWGIVPFNSSTVSCWRDSIPVDWSTVSCRRDTKSCRICANSLIDSVADWLQCGTLLYLLNTTGLSVLLSALSVHTVLTLGSDINITNYCILSWNDTKIIIVSSDMPVTCLTNSTVDLATFCLVLGDELSLMNILTLFFISHTSIGLFIDSTILLIALEFVS